MNALVEIDVRFLFISFWASTLIISFAAGVAIGLLMMRDGK